MHEAPYLRCSDADRDRAAAILREGLADGRIALAELDDRLDRVYRSQTYGELTAVMGDLPAWDTSAGAPRYAVHAPPYPMARPLPPPPAPRSGLRRFGIFAMLVWVLFLGAAASANGAGAAGIEPLLLIVTIWACILTFRHGRRGRRSYRGLPPPR